MPLDFVTSQKKHSLLKHNGFLHRKEKEINGKIIWKCIEYRTQNCRGRCHTAGDLVVVESVHNHVANLAAVQAKEVVAELRETASREHGKLLFNLYFFTLLSFLFTTNRVLFFVHEAA